MSFVDLVLLAFAGQRLQSIWFEEIAKPIRRRMINRGGRAAYLANCPMCVSVWSATVVTALWWTPLRPVDYVLAVSAAILNLQQMVTWLQALVATAQAANKVSHELASLRDSLERVVVSPDGNG